MDTRESRYSETVSHTRNDLSNEVIKKYIKVPTVCITTDKETLCKESIIETLLEMHQN